MSVKSASDDHGELVNGLQCRGVRYADKQAIVNIGCYGGRDYMAAYFDEYFNDEKFPCHMFCGVKDGVLVSIIPQSQAVHFRNAIN